MTLSNLFERPTIREMAAHIMGAVSPLSGSNPIEVSRPN